MMTLVVAVVVVIHDRSLTHADLLMCIAYISFSVSSVELKSAPSQCFLLWWFNWFGIWPKGRLEIFYVQNLN